MGQFLYLRDAQRVRPSDLLEGSIMSDSQKVAADAATTYAVMVARHDICAVWDAGDYTAISREAGSYTLLTTHNIADIAHQLYDDEQPTDMTPLVPAPDAAEDPPAAPAKKKSGGSSGGDSGSGDSS